MGIFGNRPRIPLAGPRFRSIFYIDGSAELSEETEDVMIITAKFASTCPCCGQSISVGSKVEWTRGSKARHPACAARPGAVSAPSSSAPRRSSYPRREDCRKYGWDGVYGSLSYYSSGQYDEDS